MQVRGLRDGMVSFALADRSLRPHGIHFRAVVDIFELSPHGKLPSNFNESAHGNPHQASLLYNDVLLALWVITALNKLRKPALSSLEPPANQETNDYIHGSPGVEICIEAFSKGRGSHV